MLEANKLFVSLSSLFPYDKLIVSKVDKVSCSTIDGPVWIQTHVQSESVWLQIQHT